MLLNKITDIVTFLWLVCLMFHMGSSVTMPQMMDSMRKRAVVWKGLLTNFLLVPFVAFGLLLLFKPNPLVAAGFLIGVIFSGAPMGPAFTALAKGDIPLSIGLMIIFAVLSTIISPAILKLLLAGFSEGQPIEVNYLKILKVVALGQLLPLSVGLALKHWLPIVVERISKPIRFANNVLLLGACSLIILTNYHTLALFGWRAAVGSVIVFTSCLAMGWAMGGPVKADRKALAMNSTVRNAPAALVVASANFAGTVAPAAVFVYSLVTIVGSLIAALLLGRKKSV